MSATQAAHEMAPSDTVTGEVQPPPPPPALPGRPRLLGLHWSDVSAPWRIGTPFAQLRREGYAAAEGSMLEPPPLDGVDLLVLHRPALESNLAVIDAARRRGIVVVVDVDDLLLPDTLPPGGLARTWHPDYERWQREQRAAAGIGTPEEVAAAPRNTRADVLIAALRAADLVTVSTLALGAAYSAFCRRLLVLPNCWDDTAPEWRVHRQPRPTVHIGFAGSDYQEENVALLQGALEPVLRVFPQARVVEGGGPSLLPLVAAPAPQLIALGSVPFAGFPLLLAQMDIVLAPLADTPFMRAKSNIRCLTAGLVGAPVVASPVGEYAAYVRHGVNGLLAASTGQWTHAVGDLVANERRRRRMGAANRQRAQAYAISANSWRWQEAYERIYSRARRP